MKLIFMGLALILGTSVGFCQVTDAEKQLTAQAADSTLGWKTGGVINLGSSQTSLTNWAAGGESSVALNGLISVYVRYKSARGVWENNLDMGYGTLRQGDEKNWRKSDDKIDFTSKYGQKAFGKVYYAALVNFKTQMANGYNYPNDSVPISKFMAPAYILGAIGLDYRPNDKFTAFVAPITSKTTIVNDKTLADAGSFAVDSGNTSITELGGYARIFFQLKLMENISLQSKVDLFSNYLKNPQNIDVSWEALLSMKVNKYISATLSTHLLYDHDIDILVDKNDNGTFDEGVDELGPRTQFKEVLSVGFSYTF